MNAKRLIPGVMGLVLLLAAGCEKAQEEAAGEGAPGAAATAGKEPLKPQTTCPMMGGKVDRSLYVDAKGYRIYVCCAGCLDAVRADPQKAIEKLKAKGEKPEKLPAICAACGQIKDSALCCRPGAAKCPKCGLVKGSPGCCKLPKN